MPMNVRLLGYCGPDLLAVSLSGDDPNSDIGLFQDARPWGEHEAAGIHRGSWQRGGLAALGAGAAADDASGRVSSEYISG
jgi:hypothetical protein